MEEIMFPVEHKECPNCKGTRFIANEVLKGEKKKGKAGPTITAFIFQHKSIIVDPTRTVLSAPIILSRFDICVNCGVVVCVSAQLGSAVPQAR